MGKSEKVFVKCENCLYTEYNRCVNYNCKNRLDQTAFRVCSMFVKDNIRVKEI